MPKTVDYYHFLISPWSYLAIGRFNAIKERTGITVNYLPIDVVSTFDKMGGLPLAKRHPSRQRYRLDELTRWADYLDISINLTPAYFPADQTLAACMLYAADDMHTGALSDAFLCAVWRDQKNLADPDTLIAIASDCGLDGSALFDKARNDTVIGKYNEATSAAHGKNVFGSPTYCVEGQVFWGQDRLDFLERAL